MISPPSGRTAAGLALLLYGNTMYNLGGDGFYIEAGVRGTVLQWNTVFDCGSGIGFRRELGQRGLRELFLPKPQRRGRRHMRCQQVRQGRHRDVQLADRQRHGIGLRARTRRRSRPRYSITTSTSSRTGPTWTSGTRSRRLTKIDKNINVEMTTDNWPGTNLRGRFWARWTGVIKTEKDGAVQILRQDS